MILKKTVLIIAFSLSLILGSGIQKGRDTVHKTMSNHRDQLGKYSVEYSTVKFSFEISWKMWTLMGEPVQDCIFGYKVSGLEYASVRNAQGQEVFSIRVPIAIQRKVGILYPKYIHSKVVTIKDSSVVQGGLRTFASSPSKIIFDAGVAGKPFHVDSYGTIIKKFESFNMPSSPNWNKFIYSSLPQNYPSTKPNSSDYYSEKEAKRIFKYLPQTKSSIHNSYSDFSFQFYSSEISSWVLSQYHKKLRIEKERLVQEKTALSNRSKAKEISEESADFWNTTENVMTTDENSKLKKTETNIRNISNHLVQIEKAKKVANSKTASFTTKKTKARNIIIQLGDIAAQIRQKKNDKILVLKSFRGKNGRWGFKHSDGTVAIQAQYYYSSFFRDDGLAKVSINRIDTGKRQRKHYRHTHKNRCSGHGCTILTPQKRYKYTRVLINKRGEVVKELEPSFVWESN